MGSISHARLPRALFLALKNPAPGRWPGDGEIRLTKLLSGWRILGVFDRNYVLDALQTAVDQYHGSQPVFVLQNASPEGGLSLQERVMQSHYQRSV